MASIINAATSGGLISTADTSGILQLQTAGTTAVTVDASQNVTFANSASLPNTFGFKNRIINGAMVIDQRNAGALITLTTTASYPVDRWASFEESDGVMTAQQVSDAPAGFLKSIRFTTTTADPSVTGAERVYSLQTIEGLNMIDLAWGTASAKTVTVSFWVKSSLTGTFGGSLRGNLNYPFSYTISSASTWEQKSITIAGPTTGTWPTDNTGFISVAFGMGIGPSLSGGGGAWTASNFIAPSGAVAVISTLNATFQVTGVQFEVGSTATSFDVRDFGRELILCQRYYQQNTVPTAGLYGNTMGQVYAGTNVQSGLQLSTPMRSTPSASIIGTLTWIGGALGNATVNLSSFGTIYYTPLTTLIGIAGTVASSQTGGYNWTLSSSAGGGYSLSAEL